METFLKLIIMLTCVSCGSPTKSDEPTLDQYVKRFELIYGKDVDNVTVYFGEMQNDNQVALCRKYPDSREVLVRYEHFIHLSDMAAEQMMFHELAHCVLDRPHTSKINKDGMPWSIMHPIAFNPIEMAYYVKHHAEYINELFHPKEHIWYIHNIGGNNE